ncbi:glycosyltransferase [Haliea sp. E1-2-M8]|uniref:glycosyltransferase n=1 Tax=Haliea sp. E1-2-M8 TaxID=3064706 RepID=UPI00271A4860|nr:glycosyltransferase [Haliea sp. E1-2-M8]MDO8861990.1 glycosyltransferase [Haliea sp. E1-2-M8]
MTPDKLRLLFVVDAIRGRNGVGTYFQDLAAHLENHEMVGRVELVAPGIEQPHPCQGRSIPMPGDATQRLYLPRLRALTQLVLEMQPDVIIVPGPGFFSLAGYWIGKKLGIPVCVTHQSDYRAMVRLYWRPLIAGIVGNLLQLLNIRMFRGSSSVITISQSMVEHARSIGAINPRLVPTPVAHGFVCQPVTAIRPKIQRVLFVGRLAAEKNIGHFLALAEQRPDLVFEIVGDGPLRWLVRQKADELPNLVFTGWLSRDQVVHHLNDNDLLILPSSVEAFGTVALEAMARQRLVLTTPVCGINQWPELASGLYTLAPDETLSSALQRIEALPHSERQMTAEHARNAACRLNGDAIQQWLNVLRSTALQKHHLPKPARSTTFALLRKLAAD